MITKIKPSDYIQTLTDKQKEVVEGHLHSYFFYQSVNCNVREVIETGMNGRIQDLDSILCIDTLMKELKECEEK